MVVTVAQESFEHLLRKGPPNGDLVSGLDELRYKILIDGIPSRGDGMVRDRDWNIYVARTNIKCSPNCACTSG